MSTPTVARTGREPEAPRTIPLADVTITWPEVSDYASGVTRMRELSGAALARALGEISLASAANHDPDAGDLAFRASGVADVLLALSAADFDSLGIDPGAITWTLGRLLSDDIASERARSHMATILEKGTVTIGAAPTAQTPAGA